MKHLKITGLHSEYNLRYEFFKDDKFHFDDNERNGHQPIIISKNDLVRNFPIFCQGALYNFGYNKSGNMIAIQGKWTTTYLNSRGDMFKLLHSTGEIRKFDNGESSLFLINSRESKLIESRIKLASLQSKYQKERASVYFAAGRNPLTP